MKKLFLLVLIVLVSLGHEFAFSDQTPPEQRIGWISNIPSDHVGVTFVDKFQPTEFSFLKTLTSLCTSLDDSRCGKLRTFQYAAIMPPCSSVTQTNCIVGITAQADSDTSAVQGKYLQSIPEKPLYAYKPDTNLGLPFGSTPSIWQLPGIRHKGGSETYAVLASITGGLRRSTSGIIERDFPEISIELFPINVVKEKFDKPVQFSSSTGSLATMEITSGGGSRCAVQDDGACGLKQTFPEHIKFGVEARLSVRISGWANGRVLNPEFNYQQGPNSSQLSLIGYPARVPTLSGSADFSKLDTATAIMLGSKYLKNGTGSLDPTIGSNAMKYFSKWNEILGNTASEQVSQWRFSSTSNYQLGGEALCGKSLPPNTFSAFVTTNSLAYSAGPPKFDSVDHSLNYSVASPHFLPDNSVFRGNYDLYLNSAVAKCLYGFSAASISATVSVTDESGKSQVATSTLNQKNNWIHLAVSGFEFSNPTISAKFTQQRESTSCTKKVGPTSTKSKSNLC